MVGPAAVTDGLPDYRSGFEIEMLAFDLGIVALLALGVPGRPRRIWEGLGIYTVGVIAVSGVWLDSAIEAAPLSLARFDLVVALLLLAAVLAGGAKRSILCGALLGTATAIKAFPALLFPNLLRDEPERPRAIIAGIVPIVIAAVLVIAMGDEFGSAIDYHTGRGLQIETVTATPVLASHLMFGTDAATVISAGGFDLSAPAAGLARGISIALTIVGVLVLIAEGWRRRTLRS